jgi:hypothetical protein
MFGDKPPELTFRPVALFTVDMHVVCALWINKVGHLYDACLASSARGSRLKRIYNSKARRHSDTFHIDAPGSFQPYFDCYRKWREDGLRAIRSELRSDRSVVAVTMDLKKFYHNIDPTFLTTGEFLAAIRFENANKRSLSTVTVHGPGNSVGA